MGRNAVAVLGATGTVGQKIIAMLDGHPDFYVGEVAASDRSVGKVYREACEWREPASRPENVAAMTVKALDEVTSPYVLSALPAQAAREVEPLLAGRGQHVVSNASALRMESNIPLVIPEVNSQHLNLVRSQTTPGKIVTNPNCAAVFLVLALAPLRDVSPIEHVSIVTLQALSGAGYPGVSSFDLIGNTIPNIGGEAPKIAEETLKILGDMNAPADFDLTVNVNRVPVVHGHSVFMHVTFQQSVNVNQVEAALRERASEFPEAYQLYSEEFAPQPARVITNFDQRAHIGQIQQGGNERTISLVTMGHNLVRGAAGAAILNLVATERFLREAQS